MSFECNFLEIIKEVGFPIAMCFYFIIKVEKTIKNNTKALNDFREVAFFFKKKK